MPVPELKDLWRTIVTPEGPVETIPILGPGFLHRANIVRLELRRRKIGDELGDKWWITVNDGSAERLRGVEHEDVKDPGRVYRDAVAWLDAKLPTEEADDRGHRQPDK